MNNNTLIRIDSLEELVMIMYGTMARKGKKEISEEQYQLVRSYLDDAIFYAMCAKNALNDSF